MRIGITGGIGSGKSYVCKRLEPRGITVYDCDAAAKRLMRTSPTLISRLTRLVGPDAYLPSPADNPSLPPTLNKAAIARFLLESEHNAKAIDAIVHPAVFRDFEESGLQWMESAILYESGISELVDRVIVVTAPLETRISRVMQRDGITRQKAVQWIERQWPQEIVRARADFEIVNDGHADIDSQIDQMLHEICTSNYKNIEQ